MQITDATFKDAVTNSDRPVLVDFWASWCPPCKMMQPMVDRLHDEYQGSADILSLNIDRNPQAAAAFGISGVPTFVAFRKGTEVARKTGALTENQLRRLIDAATERSETETVWSEPAADRTVIVTGLPRSGTSMMMRMLEAGGIPPLCDGHREADADNPNGYYEFERVKQTKEDAGWLTQAPGKAVKMVYSLLYDLPTDRTYDVIFMRRNLYEILASQERMLQNAGVESGIDNSRMARLFEREVAKFRYWIAATDHINCLEVDYNGIASGCEEPIHRINAHLGGHLDTSAMVSVVDPSLYRNRAAAVAA